MFSTPIPSLRIPVLIASILLSSFCPTTLSADGIPDDGKLRIIVFGAHPDDAELEAGGTAALWASMGHHVKFVSTTNGDIGHAVEAGAQLAVRRIREVNEADKILGVEATEVYDIHDGEIMPTLENRKMVTKSIREWKADIVIAHRPNDYHPDHRNAGVVVQDAAYLVIVPNVTPDTPPLTKNPVFLYMRDRFKKPYPFSKDIAVVIDKVVDKKIEALAAHDSQMFEWLPWVSGVKESDVPKSESDRLAWLKKRYASKKAWSKEDEIALKKWYPNIDLDSVNHIEFFEICEYGKQPNEEEIKRLFPMLNN